MDWVGNARGPTEVRPALLVIGWSVTIVELDPEVPPVVVLNVLGAFALAAASAKLEKPKDAGGGGIALPASSL